MESPTTKKHYKEWPKLLIVFSAGAVFSHLIGWAKNTTMPLWFTIIIYIILAYLTVQLLLIIRQMRKIRNEIRKDIVND